MTESNDSKLIHIYNSYIKEFNENKNVFDRDEDGRVRVSTDMGYISSVDQARKNLEKLYNIKES